MVSGLISGFVSGVAGVRKFLMNDISNTTFRYLLSLFSHVFFSTDNRGISVYGLPTFFCYPLQRQFFASAVIKMYIDYS